MIIAYLYQYPLKPISITKENIALLQESLWIDLFNPSKDEEKLIEQELNFNIPTPAEMKEIEISSRLYKKNNASYMTVMMIAESDSPQPKIDAVTLIITDGKFITIRFIQPQTFVLFNSRLPLLTKEDYTPENLLIELLDIAIDRLADILEKISYSLDHYSQTIFRSNLNAPGAHKTNYKQSLKDIGASGDLNTKVQESLITFDRLTTFFIQVCAAKLSPEMQLRVKLLTKDIKSLNDHLFFLSNKVNFLLDATLGMINIEQNDIIKIFSIVAVILLPPTLIASIYGMNFHAMPELSWRFGYPFALLIMLISAWLPYKYFKRRKWL